MPYIAEISRNSPTCFLFLIDQSFSMTESVGGTPGVQKAAFVADALNKTLQNLGIAASKLTGAEMEIRDYFDIGVIGYGLNVGPAFVGPLVGKALAPLSEVGYNPARIEVRQRKVPDGAGGIITEDIRFPIWFDAVANGATPMCEALSLAHSILEPWIADHPDAFPPIVLNLTDGQPTDGDPRPIAAHLRSLETSDGNVLLFNLHVSTLNASPLCFPNSAQQLPADQYAHLMFDMSSPLSSFAWEMAQQDYPGIEQDARGFVFNAGIEDIVHFLNIGTRVKVRQA